MHRIDGAGATVTGQWTKGNPSTGVPATEITDDWMNAIQNEVENVIVTGAGGTLNKANNAQLLAAILTVITNNLVPPSFTVSGLPAASSNSRRIVYVSNESGGAVLAYSDGSQWRRVTDRVVVS